VVYGSTIDRNEWYTMTAKLGCCSHSDIKHKEKTSGEKNSFFFFFSLIWNTVLSKYYLILVKNEYFSRGYALIHRWIYISLKSVYTNGRSQMLFTDVIKRIIDIFLSFLNNDSRKQPYTIEKEWINEKRKESKRSIIWFQFSLLFFSSLDLDAFL